MNNLISLLTELSHRDFNMKESNDEILWSQTERNQVRNQIIDSILLDINEAIKSSSLSENGLEGLRTSDGASINVPNDEWGSFAFSIVPKMHSLDYDIIEQNQEYLNKRQKKED